MRTSTLPRKRELFEQLVALRQTAQHVPLDAGLAAVRASLERELGQTVSIRLASELLGVSHTAIRRWVSSGDLATVYARSGRQEIPLGTVLDLHETISAAREAGRRHVIEPAMREARQRAGRLKPSTLLSDTRNEGGHSGAERRALAYHRVVAKRLRRKDVNDAHQLLLSWRKEGRIDARYADEWAQLLAQPMLAIRRALSADTQQMRDLRQNSPFAGMLSDRERAKIIAEV